jgi:NAD(P)-dependent dehydrogenase (short-subunit alcohol dehydrogenase family)
MLANVSLAFHPKPEPTTYFSFTSMDILSLDLGLADRSVIVTGGAGLIGRIVVDHFLAAGSKVSSLDIVYPDDGSTRPDLTRPAFAAIHCDVSNEVSIQQAFAKATQAHGPIEICIALASLDLSVLRPAAFADASFNQLQRVLSVNVTGTWLTARAWVRGLRQAKLDSIALEHPNLIMIGSESGHFGERHAVDYSLGKSAVQGGLLMSLRAETPRVWPGARVNVLAPGPVATDRWHEECKRDPNQLYLEAQATVILIPRSVPVTLSDGWASFPSFYFSTPTILSCRCITNGLRRRYANPFLSELSQWQSYLSQATTSAAMFMAKLSTWMVENRAKSCGPRKSWLETRLKMSSSRAVGHHGPMFALRPLARRYYRRHRLIVRAENKFILWYTVHTTVSFMNH